MPSTTPSHHVSQPISATWLDDPPVSTAPPPPQPPPLPPSSDPIKQNNTSPTAPSNSISTTDHTKPHTHQTNPVSVPTHTHPEAQDQPSSLSLSYQNPSTSPPLTTQPQHSAPFSNLSSPSHNQPQSFTHHERSLVLQQSQQLAEQKNTSPTDVFIPTSAQLQPETLPPNQYAHLQQQQQQQAHDDRHSTASSRFANLLNVSNRATAKYPASISASQTLQQEHILPPSSQPATQAQQVVSDSVMNYRTIRDEQSGPHQRLNQNAMTPQPYQTFQAQNKLFEGIEQMAKQQSQFLHSQAQTQAEQTNGQDGRIGRHLQNSSRQYQQPFQQWQSSRVLQPNSTPQHSQTQYPSYAYQNSSQFYVGTQAQASGRVYARDHVYEVADRYRGMNDVRAMPHDGFGQMNGYRPLPSARSLHKNNSMRPVHASGRTDNGYKTEAHAFEIASGTRIPQNVRQRREHSNPFQNMSASWDLVHDAVKQCPTLENTYDRDEFLTFYLELLKWYEDTFEVYYDVVDTMCIGFIMNSRVPYLVDTITAPVDDETPEDAQQKLIVKKKFVEAIERLQGDQLPTKRRGNLPKESTAYLKRWFDEHYDHPYPSDEEKLEMSKITKIGIQQISHWFINFRKRVWKPSLPPTHPVHMGENTKRPRKRMRNDYAR